MARTKFTPAQLIYGLIRHRQGGTTGDASWNTGGSSNTDISEKQIFIQVGTASVNTDPFTITFPVPFSQPPVVMGSAVTANSFHTFARFDTVTATTCRVSMRREGGSPDSTTTEDVSWIAIGQ